MKWRRHLSTMVLCVTLVLQSTLPVAACGREYLEPVFFFRESPDFPFAHYAAGKIGIIQPTFGKKTLVIAYRYLNGGSFTADEQKDLVTALRGTPPERSDDSAISDWISVRKEFVSENEPLPEIYSERRNQGYDFFPNCARNAFEVATETLKDRAGRYGAADRNFRQWLTAQDAVFKNCSGGSTIPGELGAESPDWLRRDRQYQIAAAYFYSLNFEAARARFEAIAEDTDSPWRETADYLVARTLVRQASLTENKTAQRELYDRAEVRLQSLLARNSSFSGAQERLLGLIKYRIHPAERIGELARSLAQNSRGDNLKQDLIDYVWLFDKFQARALKEEHERQEAAKPPAIKKDEYQVPAADRERYMAIQRGELFEIW